MKKWGKKGIIGIIIVVVLMVVALSSFKSVKVDTETARKADVTASVTEKGKVVSEDKADIYSELQGRINQVLVDEGDSVEKGKLLAVLDPADLEAQIAQLEGELKTSKGNELSSPSGGNGQITQQQLALEQAQANLKRKEADYTRIKKLYSSGAVTMVEFEQAQTDLENSRKEVARLTSILAETRQQSKGSNMQYQGQKESVMAKINHLKLQKDKTRIIAARAGLIFSKKVESGDFVAPGSLLFVLGTPGKLNLEIYINAKDMVNINKGDTVKVVFEKPGKNTETSGQITKIAPATVEITSSLGVIENRIKVTVELMKQPDGVKLIPGMSADITLITQAARNVVEVSKDAVYSDGGKDYVWSVKNGKAALTQVETGVEGDETIEIRKGLAVGDTVIMDPHQTGLQEGVRIN